MRYFAKGRSSKSISMLNNDCLMLILEELHQCDRTAVASLSRTSRRFYQLATPLNHRHIKINFLDGRSLHLLRRLENATPKVKAYVQSLEVSAHEDWNSTEDPNFAYFLSLCQTLKNLKRFRWVGLILLPPALLDILSTLPLESLELPALDKMDNVWTSVCWPSFLGSRWDFLAHPLTSTLTIFHWYLRKPEQVYTGFKKELLMMLRGCEDSLKDFAICPAEGFQSDIQFPEMIPEFKRHHFSKLEAFQLSWSLDIFTTRELMVWGKQNAWDNLKTLVIPSHHIPALLETTYNLMKLMVYVTPEFLAERFDEWLNRLRVKPTFSHLQSLWVTEPIPCMPGPNYRTVPVSFLELLSHLQYCRVDSTSGSTLGQSLYEARDICTIRELCPKLDELDIIINPSDRWWPFPILREMSLLKTHVWVGLWVSLAASGSEFEQFFSYRNCRKAYKYMLSSRTSSGLGTRGHFPVTFIPYRPAIEDGSEPWQIPEYNFCMDHRGKILAWTTNMYNLDYDQREAELGEPNVHAFNSLDDEQLRARLAKKGKCTLQEHLFPSPKTYKKERREIQALRAEEARRRRNSDAAKKFGDYATLYDIMAKPGQVKGQN